MLIFPVLFLLIFRYVPMLGNILAFRRYSYVSPLFGKEWVGLEYFRQFLFSGDFWVKFKNTIALSASTLVFTFPMPIIFALLLNEIQHIRVKKFIQTVSYLPHFISAVVLVGMIAQMFSVNGGVVNNMLKSMGGRAVNFMNLPQWFRPLYIGSELWQQMGWNAIIFIAALSGVDVQLYEAAMIDGANRWRQTIHITLPALSTVIVISLILSVGGILSVGFEKVLLLMNPLNMDTSDVISTYVYKIGIVNSNYSFSTAVDLFNAVTGLILVTTANYVSGKISDTSLW
jgi:putative aldouronate transport system permease protein